MTDILGIANDKNLIWYVSANTYLLIELSLVDFSVKKRVILDKVYQKNILFSDGIIYDNKLIFAPWSMSEILIFDRQTLEPDYIQIKNTSKDFFLCQKILVLQKRIFFIPFRYHAIVELNLETREISYHKKPIKVLNVQDKINMSYFKDAEWLREGIMLLPSYNSNKIVSYNINTHKTKVYNFENQNLCLQKCICFGGQIFILPRNENRIYRYSYDFKAIGVISLGEYCLMTINENSIFEDAFFADFVDCGDYFLLVQCQSEHSYIIDKYTYKVEQIELFIPFSEEESGIWTVKKVSDEFVVLSGLYNNQWIAKFNIKERSIHWYKLPTKMNNNFCYFSKAEYIMYENKESTVQEYISETIKF